MKKKRIRIKEDTERTYNETAPINDFIWEIQEINCTGSQIKTQFLNLAFYYNVLIFRIYIQYHI